ncbi:hypothetical protein RND71_030494 [Anisodus tanguticus]|uniref:Sulfotransferase n=1 Tax=Anisodus tanguticus TaxID=243964 RepID=A0AAE1RG60_9SOLA|nr:hypothetical protein RND71_030494 [Anisodus tanguticus]
MATQESNSNIIDSCKSTSSEDAMINDLPSALCWDALEIRKSKVPRDSSPLSKNHDIAESEDILTKVNPQFQCSSDSVKNSTCKIVCIARNPKDMLVSFLALFNSIFKPNQEPYPLERAVEEFCTGVHQYGRIFENVLGYWLESQKRPENILFLKYEEMIKDPKEQVKNLASFLGKPFEKEEDVEKVVWRCSLERLRNLEVNKNSSVIEWVPNNIYFRKGMVGDWKNYLTPEMGDRINRITPQIPRLWI